MKKTSLSMNLDEKMVDSELLIIAYDKLNDSDKAFVMGVITALEIKQRNQNDVAS